MQRLNPEAEANFSWEQEHSFEVMTATSWDHRTGIKTVINQLALIKTAKFLTFLWPILSLFRLKEELGVTAFPCLFFSPLCNDQLSPSFLRPSLVSVIAVSWWPSLPTPRAWAFDLKL